MEVLQIGEALLTEQLHKSNKTWYSYVADHKKATSSSVAVL
jgi:hypothetical protein